MSNTRVAESPSDGLCPYQRAIHLVRDELALRLIRAAVTSEVALDANAFAVLGLSVEVLENRLELLVQTGVFHSHHANGSVRYSLAEPGMKLVIILRALGRWADEFALPSPGSSK